MPVVDVWAYLVQACGVSDDELARRVAVHFGLRVADFDTAQPRAVRLVPDELAIRYCVFPLREDDRQLLVATSDPTDTHVEQAIGFASGRIPVFEVAPPAAIEAAIESNYSANRVLEGLLSSVSTDAVDEVSLLEEAEPEMVAAEEVETGPVVKLTSLILGDAARGGASDMHLEPGRHGGTVRFRIDGVLQDYMTMPMSALTRVVSRIKILGKMDIADRFRPQDGRTSIRVQDRTYDLRISTVPTRDSEKAVVRFLDPEGALGLEQIGLLSHELGRVKKMLSQREGMVFVTGPTGSGKTTTLFAALRDLASREVNVMTIEDPVEFDLPGVTQIQVEPRRGVTFVSALRAILRQDPDVILVGEIRDLETADIAIQASLTGHLVLASLHTIDAISVISRLSDLGVDRASIVASLRGVVAQRLLRRVCQHCAQRIERGQLSEDEAILSAKYGVEPIMRATGCERCGQTGYSGRMPVMEVLVATQELEDLITSRSSSSELKRAAIAAGMRTMGEVALDRVRDGTTTLQEIERALGETEGQTPAPATDAPAAATPAANAPATDQPHVLVVDDDPGIREALRRVLEKSDFQISDAADGLEAVELLGSAGQYDLVVLDLDMPGLDGHQVLRQIRSSVATAGLPVVVLTGSHDEDREIRLLEDGADDYVRKPFDAPRFVARIQAALRRAAT